MFKDVYDVYVHRYENMRGVYVAEEPKKAIIPSTTNPEQFAKDVRKYGINANKNWITFGDGVTIVEGHCADKHVYFSSYDEAVNYMKAVWRREAV